MGFAEGVTAGNERDGFFVVHRHAGERFPDISRRGDRIGLSIRPFRIHIDQTHLHRAERILKITVTGVALVREPRALGSPIDFLFGLPHVGPTAAKTEGLEAHGFEGDVAGENHQVGPGNFPAILLLDRPEQTAGFVEVHVVRPAIEGAKRCWPDPAPPRPSPMRYVPALCHAIRMKSGPNVRSRRATTPANPSSRRGDP